MRDRLLRGTFPSSNLRFAVCETRELCSEGLARLKSDWIAGWLLSEALTCAALLSVGLKDEERLSLRWAYSGPVGTILADMNEKAQVRGFTQRLRLMPGVSTLDEAMGGSGKVSVVSSFPDRVGQMGITEAVFQDITRDLAHFLSLSFQIETALAVGLIIRPEDPIHLSSATGLLLQPLPGCDYALFNGVREIVEHQGFRDWLEAAPRMPEEVLARLGLKETPSILNEITPSYSCHCSREKVESVLRMLDAEELRDMLEKDGHAEINCHFCAEHYWFSGTDLQSLIEQCQAGHA
ncbi:MAG: Hsp33 family molecular chaperone HslO [SAR324 cluster bacterium]|nr:Hsp33 family molecular chaperone HslO [SAR324 cluster bacterium]MCZ6557245.1 Hsp33 family molecular chaperone HslO [SAR324 cluster bacterium]MCZ6728944.1 Hsp33 family molecular chaperone HslO [SAR324 cluster bacterium]